MLEPIRYIISRQKNILASSSIRRQEILKSVNFNFEVVKPDFEENLNKSSFSHPCEYVKENAKQKALSVWRRLAKENQTADLVIGCDTVVTLGGSIFEKPKDIDDALKMLLKLSGKTHTVFTGVALITAKQFSNEPQSTNSSNNIPAEDHYLVTTFHEATDVTMSEMDKTIIEAYIKTGEPMDKAGSYAIQGIGATLIESIRGDYFNVVGLPLHRLAKELYYMFTE